MNCSEFRKSPKVTDNGSNQYGRLSTAIDVLADVTRTSRLFGFDASPGDSYVTTSWFARHSLAWSLLRQTV